MLHTTKLLTSAHLTRAIGSCLGGSLLLFLFALLAPVVPELSQAAPTSAVSDQAAVQFSTNILPAISVAVESTVNLEVAPSSTGSFATVPTTVTISTNSREGYSLFLEASGDTNALLPQLNKDNPSTIASLDANTTEADFPSNHWGVNLASTNNYQPIPLNATNAIVSSDTANAADTYTLNFAVKVDDTLPVDNYSGTVLLSAVANPVAAHNLAELVYMQNMTPEICENTADYIDVDHYVTKQLIDIRDGKSYWVAKLADGNCWMVQNLGLVFKNSDNGIISATADGGDGAQLTSDNTDITAASWAPAEPSKTAGNATGTQAIAWNLNLPEVGNQQYYTWSAATAGTGTNQATSGQIMPSSICPKGWKLPLAGVLTNDASTGPYDKGTFDSTSGSFQYLFTAYELSVDSGPVLLEPPFNFVKAGYVNHDATLQSVGTGASFWSSVSANITWGPVITPIHSISIVVIISGHHTSLIALMVYLSVVSLARRQSAEGESVPTVVAV